ncbi:unnamed protein product, partial [Closterium sp. NIES-65]
MCRIRFRQIKIPLFHSPFLLWCSVPYWQRSLGPSLTAHGVGFVGVSSPAFKKREGKEMTEEKAEQERRSGEPLEMREEGEGLGEVGKGEGIGEGEGEGERGEAKEGGEIDQGKGRKRRRIIRLSEGNEEENEGGDTNDDEEEGWGEEEEGWGEEEEGRHRRECFEAIKKCLEACDGAEGTKGAEGAEGAEEADDAEGTKGLEEQGGSSLSSMGDEQPQETHKLIVFNLFALVRPPHQFPSLFARSHPSLFRRLQRAVSPHEVSVKVAFESTQKLLRSLPQPPVPFPPVAASTIMGGGVRMDVAAALPLPPVGTVEGSFSVPSSLRSPGLSSSHILQDAFRTSCSCHPSPSPLLSPPPSPPRSSSPLSPSPTTSPSPPRALPSCLVFLMQCRFQYAATFEAPQKTSEGPQKSPVQCRVRIIPSDAVTVSRLSLPSFFLTFALSLVPSFPPSLLMPSSYQLLFQYFLPPHCQRNVLLYQYFHPPRVLGVPRSQNNVFYVGFSSMGSMGLLPRPALLLATIIAAAEALNLRAVVVTSGDSALEEAVAAVCRDEKQHVQEQEEEWRKRAADLVARGRGEMLSVDEKRWLLSQRPSQPAPPQLSTSPLLPLGLPRMFAGGMVLALRGPVSHEWLFPRCCFVLHHAG